MSKYYLVDGLGNDGYYCFDSITSVKEIADEKGLSLEELEIWDVRFVPLVLDASSLVQEAIYIGDYVDNFTEDEIPEEKLQELQMFLNMWCKDIDTYTYERKDLLNIEEVMRRLKNDK